MRSCCSRVSKSRPPWGHRRAAGSGVSDQVAPALGRVPSWGPLPLAIATGTGAVAASIVASVLALFAIGAGITLITGRHPLASGLRQVLFGVAAAAVTFGIGRLVGVGLTG